MSRSERISRAVASLHPGYFALVMATGILSTATDELKLPWLSLPLLGIAALCYLVLLVAICWRLVRFPRRVLADAGMPDRAFAFFTFVAGTDVLGLRLAAAGQAVAAQVLVALGAVAWLVLTYAIPTALIAAPLKDSFAAKVNGTWLIWVVGTQSVASSAAVVASLHLQLMAGLAFLAVAFWGFAVVLYVLLMAIVLPRLLLGEISPDQLAPPYWITMGATAITVFAASRILILPARLPVTAPTLSGLTFLLWSFGTWWIPLLLLLGVWRHLLRRVPLKYEPALWSMVFPLGMYAAASAAFGQVEGLGALQWIARVEVWFGLAAWAATLVAMLHHLRGLV